MTPDYYPMLLDIRERPVLVIGGGRVAQRKVRTFLDCGARVRVVAPELTDELIGLSEDGSITHEAREYRTGDVVGASLVVVAVNDEDVSRAAAAECRERSVFVNVVDKPEHCDFIVPAVIRRGPMTISVSTGGASPAWARKLRERLQGEFGEAYGRLLEAAAETRKRCLVEIQDPERRREALSGLADDGLLDLAATVDVAALKREMATRTGLSIR